MSATATLADTLPSAIRDKLLERAVMATPLAFVSLFVNERRRDGKNDPQFTGRLDLPVARVQEEMAKALAKGHSNIQVYLDVWTNDEGGPVMTGRARNVVPDEKRFEPKPQVPAANTPTAEPTAAEIAATMGASDTGITP